MQEFDFNHVWNLQETFYKDRPLMWKDNQNVINLLKRIEDEAQECKEEIEHCMKFLGPDQCVDLMDQQIRQEVSDLFLFVLALARCIGLQAPQVLSDAVDKIARNIGRYAAVDYQDSELMHTDQVEKSRGWDKRRGYTTQYYQIAV